jgi:hypothetical protein
VFFQWNTLSRKVHPRTTSYGSVVLAGCGDACEIVARKIIEINAAGWHEPEEIAKLAAAQLG